MNIDESRNERARERARSQQRDETRKSAERTRKTLKRYQAHREGIVFEIDWVRFSLVVALAALIVLRVLWR